MPRLLWQERETEVGKKLKELAKKTPLHYFLPDPYDPSSYVHPISAMTRLGAVRALFPHRYARPREVRDAIRMVLAYPKHYLDTLTALNVHSLEKPYTEGFYRMLRKAIDVFGSSRPQYTYRLPEVVGHEFGHHTIAEEAKLLIRDVPSRLATMVRDMESRLKAKGQPHEIPLHVAFVANLPQAFDEALAFLYGIELMKRARVSSMPTILRNIGQAEHFGSPYREVLLFLEEFLRRPTTIRGELEKFYQALF